MRVWAIRLRGCAATADSLRRACQPKLARRKLRERRLVRKGGLEPPRPCGHKLLRLARLPIPPLPQAYPPSRRGRGGVASNIKVYLMNRRSRERQAPRLGARAASETSGRQ